MRFVSIIIFVNVTNRYDSVDVIMNVGAIPSDITALVAEGIKNIWHNVKLRGRGYSRANEIVSYAEKSVGLTDGTDAGREAIKWYAEQILKLDEQLAVIESVLHEKCREIPYAENILAINGVGENILAGILAEMGDISRFDDVKEIQKLSGWWHAVRESIKDRQRSATEDARDCVTGCFRWQSQQCRMRMNSNSCTSITQPEATIH